MLCLCCCNRKRRLKRKQLEAKDSSQNEEKLDHEVSDECAGKSGTLLYDTTRRKTSVWHQSHFAGLLKSAKTVILESDHPEVRQVGCQSYEEVSLFDIAESRSQNLNLGKCFGQYMTRIYFSERLRSPALNTKELYDFDAVIRLYKQFEMTNYADEEKIPSNDEFRNTLFRTLFYIMPQSGLEYKMSFLRRKDTQMVGTEAINGDSRWLKLMSWWKLANNSLARSCAKLHKCLRNSTEFFNLKNDRTIAKIMNDLNSFLIKLNLVNLSAEVSALQLYVYLPQKLPDIEIWPISRENAFTGFEENFFPCVSQDSLWTYFLRECSNHILNLFTVVMKFVIENEKILNKTQKIRTIVKNLTENFFHLVIQPLSEEDDDENNPTLLIEAAQKNFESFLGEVRVKKNTEDGCKFETVILLTSRLLVTQMKLTVKTFQNLFYTSKTLLISEDLISKYLRDTVTNGIILAKRALERDLLSDNFLLKLHENEHFTNMDLSLDRSIKYAYILVSCYRIMSRKEELMLSLPHDFIRHDFVAFLNNIQQHSNRSITEEEILPMEFSLKLGTFRDQLTQKLGKSLDNITKVSNSANVLLCKAKYIQREMTFE